MKNTTFQGRIWLITDAGNHLMDDIDTDMIYHNAHLAVTDIAEMGQYAFGNLEGWKDFARKTKSNDIVICGKNFGSGSSRQHAVDCFKALGVCALICESYGAIYKRNAINAGFPILECRNFSRDLPLHHGQEVILDIATGTVVDPESGEQLLKTDPLSQVQMDIYQAGNIFEFGKTIA